MDVDVFIWGGTHRFEAYELDGKFFINPGSATGAVSAEWGSELSKRVQNMGGLNDDRDETPTPSFVLMDVQGNVVVLYVYQLIDDEIKVEKLQYRAP